MRTPHLFKHIVLLTAVFVGLARAHSTSEFHIHVLVFSKTAGFRHASIPDGIAMLQSIGLQRGWIVTAGEDASLFSDAGLAEFDVVVFLSTTGDILDAAQQAAFERFIQGGGGYTGIHAAADTEFSWPWYGDLVGAYFLSHPEQQNADILIEDKNHPSTSFLPDTWNRFDEWYNFQSNPRNDVNVLMTLDESTYNPGAGAMGDHPIAWYHEYDGGRAFYTALGHTSASFTADASFRDHVTGGIEWAADYNGGWLGPAPQPSDFSRVTLASSLVQPMELDIAPDGHIYIIGRCGAFYVWSPSSQSATQTSTLPVRCDLENGLIGLALDPNFVSNRHVFTHYTPEFTDLARVSRFTINPDHTIDFSSEIIVLEYPIQNQQCCHVAGCLEFGIHGELFITTGDNTNPFASNGFTPIDERPSRAPWDAQKSSSNTNDLRGGILRIMPQPDGSYTIPEGNLFAADSLHKPEIYIKGNRNPFRLAVDPATGWIYWGEVGPDANASNALRGPSGYDEINQARQAGFYGWPYFSGFNEAYVEYDFATGVSGAPYDAANVINNSPNNTGATNLPSPVPAWLRYPHAALMAGPFYRFNGAIADPKKLPSYYDGTLFFWNFNNTDIFNVMMDPDGTNPVDSPVFTGLGVGNTIDMTLAPSTHRLHILQFATNGNRNNGQLYRLDYNGTQQGGGNSNPVIVASADPIEGPIPLTVNFSTQGTFDPEFQPLTYAWDFTTDGSIDSTDPNPTYVYNTSGIFNTQLRVTDTDQNESVWNVQIRAGLNSPIVSFTYPQHPGGFFDWGDVIGWSATVDDLEDGTPGNDVDCEDVRVDLSLGHRVPPTVHEHGLETVNACVGNFTTSADTGHAGEDVFLYLTASYTDTSGVSGSTQMILQPKHKEAEHFSTMAGIQTQPTEDVGGGLNVGWINGGDFMSYDNINLFNIDSITLRVSSDTSGGNIEVRLGAVSGSLVGTAVVSNTGGWQNWTSINMPVPQWARDSGENELFLVFTGSSGFLLNINWMEFNGSGIAGAIETTPPTPNPAGFVQVPTAQSD